MSFPKMNKEDWDKLMFFKEDEFKCSHSGANGMSRDFIIRLEHLRAKANFPFVITSGYRSLSHPVEAAKEKAGMHTKGIAADIKVNSGEQRYLLLQYALELGFTGIGVAKDFIHVDIRDSTPVVWSY